MSGRRFGGGGAFGLGLDYKDLKEVQLDIDGKKTLVLPVNGPLNELEKATSTQFIHFQELMKDGPFYTGSMLYTADNSAAIKQQQVEDVGINDGIKRYSDRYAKKRKISRSISDHPFKIEFLPYELHDVINNSRKTKKGLLRLNSYQEKSNKFYLDSLNNSGEEVGEDQFSKEVLERLKNIAEVEDDKDKKEDQEQDFEEEEEDDFDDEDDDDYNAEKYFDDGEEFDEDGGDGGDEAEF